MVQERSTEDILGTLVAFPTVSEDTNLPLIDYVEEYLSAPRGDGAACREGRRAEGEPLRHHRPGQTAGGVVLSGHTDVVPTTGQVWRHDPFKLTREGERLYGRGTTDMKGFIAVSLAMVPEMLAGGLKRPVHLAFSYDEEMGCLGAPAMIEEMGRRLPPVSAVIVGEPTSMRVVTGHKGVVKMTTRIRGREVHSSVVDKGVSANLYAARLAVWLDDRMRANRDHGAKDPRFDPPYTTLHSGIIRGGTAFNITARDCTLVSDIRVLPDEHSADYIAEFRAYAEELAAEMKTVDPQVRHRDRSRVRRPGLPQGGPRQRRGAGARAHRRQWRSRRRLRHGSRPVPGRRPFRRRLRSRQHGPGARARTNSSKLSQLRAGEAFQRRLIEHLAS